MLGKIILISLTIGAAVSADVYMVNMYTKKTVKQIKKELLAFQPIKPPTEQ